MHSFVSILVAMSPLTIAFPYDVSPRDTNGCTTTSSGDFSWTIEAFDFHSSDIFTTPAHEVAYGYVNFNLTNPALPERVLCTAYSSALTSFFYGGIDYTCAAPAGSKTKTSFTFSRITNGLSINQTWTCSDGNPQQPSTFIGYGTVNLTLNCQTSYYRNPNYTSPDNGFYSTSDTTCAPVTLPLTPRDKTVAT
ncbi:hypothetical protein E0Z10_g10 [Xylaria hypoxylon]|uniref:AA1-like domain-containing protein n=1 Tax=Xylaria hypoxylon TaxID=37992 RepID=A0A4Z0ZCB7_9PEZI|nr:hypothetical protein E0Z10_g10 [Xylaria hypoxylon]